MGNKSVPLLSEGQSLNGRVLGIYPAHLLRNGSGEEISAGALLIWGLAFLFKNDTWVAPLALWLVSEVNLPRFPSMRFSLSWCDLINPEPLQRCSVNESQAWFFGWPFAEWPALVKQMQSMPWALEKRPLTQWLEGVGKRPEESWAVHYIRSAQGQWPGPCALHNSSGHTCSG